MTVLYDDILKACEKTLLSFDETEELLEYPEVQADKGYYLSLLEKYNSLSAIRDKYAELKEAISEEETANQLLSEGSEKEKAELYREISALRRHISALTDELATSLGYGNITERVFCRITCSKTVSSKLGTQLFELIKADLSAKNVTLTETVAKNKNGSTEITFSASGINAMRRLSVLSGVHKVYIPLARGEEITLAVTPSAEETAELKDTDLKIDIFHSSGAGGQNINKVETAVRVTHIPTGTVVVCQDERSQIKNKKRAMETLYKRLSERKNAEEKERMESDLRGQEKKVSAITFDSSTSTMTDNRLTAKKIPFPPSAEQFGKYLDALMAIRN